ncbi:probable methyltransferase-like protein 25 [Musca vetustissima]|uniref:probable methyltransferase-like protein 25 n=1 Tax=Musca vetustissima TaxID=27455 RepID=UPI002AB6E441|nr:probable methyltransferase-like protein 25 [Musca vetustissima]
MSMPQICKRLDAILKLMEPYWPWVNCHMVNFITDKHWVNFVPKEIQQELQNPDDIQQCIESVFWADQISDDTKFPETVAFIQTTQAHCLENFKEILLTKDDLTKCVLKLSTELAQHPISIKEFLSEKKKHEVEMTASLVNDLIQGTSTNGSNTVVVDAGDGKGYLSSRLALEYGYNVLGIDSNPSNTENALERNKKLKKAWNGLKERAELESKGITPPRRGRQKQKPTDNETQINSTGDNDNYKTVDKFITTDLDINSLLDDHFPNVSTQHTSVCLTGLHTCGNLASACLKLFHHQEKCKILCNIGCCYHLLKEQYSGQEFFGNKHIVDMNPETGFPLSSYLQEKRTALGRNARMLAVQSTDRTKASKELPNISLLYRALFEILVCEAMPEMKDAIQVGKLRKFNNFQEYVELCKKKHHSLEVISQERIDTIAAEGEHHKSHLDMFYLLRMSFAPVLETIILLDRLLFLLENGHKQSYILAAFDAVVSPRRFAIISIKE